MKTSVEISGYLITIEEVDGVISVNAAKDDEVVEEFTIAGEESEEGFEGEAPESEEGDDVRPFGEYDEEEDFDSEGGMGEIQDEIEDDDDEDEDDDDDDDENENPALESFQAFINKKPTSKRK